MYLFEGNEWSMHFVRLNLGDRFHHIPISFLVFLVIICLIAEMLMGS